jgi:ATP-dependent DNA helicase RecG
MSAAPVRLPVRDKEPPFDVPALRQIICDLQTHTAEEVECDQIEIKGWCPNDKELALKVADACSCLANACGGTVVIGVADGVKVGRKFARCPHSKVNTTWLQMSIHNQTHPPVDCSVFDGSSVLADVTGVADADLFAVRVPRTRYIGGHVTSSGVSKVRVGKECVTQYIAHDDRTRPIVPTLTVEDLSAPSIEWGMGQHQRHFKASAAWADQAEFLAQAGLVEPYLPDEEILPQFRVSLAALLLFGKQDAISRSVPFFETVILTGRERILFHKNIVESVRELCIGESSLLRSRLPQIPAEVVKELVVNAYIHRCYRISGPIIIQISEEGLEIRSPGELLAGLTVNDLINGVAMYRNLLLADGARYIGLCDKIGQGIDLVFKGVLSSGLGFPEFESGNSLFTARVPLSGSAEFKEFVRKRGQALGQLDQIIVLRALWGRDTPKSFEELRAAMQRRQDFARRVLDEMTQKGMIEPNGGPYRLTDVVRHDIETVFQSDQLSLDASMWGEPR